MTTQLIISSLFICFVATVFVLQCLRPVANTIGLLDKPEGRRKTHIGSIPLIGGIAIYFVVLVLSVAFLQNEFITSLLLCAGVIVLMGALDDRYDLPAKKRLAIQFLVCGLVVVGLDVRIESMGNLVNLGEIKLGLLSVPVSIIALMAAMNAMNFMDGIDGLVGSIAVVSFTSLAYLFFRNQQADFGLLSLTLSACTISFLVFNLWGKPNQPYFHKVFMGDAGSMFLGVVLGALIIKGSQGESASFTPISGLWLILLPLTDMATLMYRRIRRGQSPMTADRTHLHHLFLRAGLSSKKTLLIITSVQMVLALISYSHVPLSWLIHASLIVVWVVGYQILMFKAWRIMRFISKK